MAFETLIQTLDCKKRVKNTVLLKDADITFSKDMRNAIHEIRAALLDDSVYTIIIKKTEQLQYEFNF